MATDFAIRIVVDPAAATRGTKRVRDELDKTEKKADGLGKTIKRALVGLAAGLGVREIARLGDSFVDLQNKIRTVTSSQEELTRVTGEVFDIAKRTRSSVESTAQAFTRFRRATETLGLSQQEVLQFTESVNQAIIVSGATATEASAGMIQFSQGLAAGALRGDELRSVLEQLPVIAQVLQDDLGITRGELRKMGEEGLLTTDLFVKAFSRAEHEIANNFGKTVPTIGQAIENLKTFVIELLGTLEGSLGVFSLVADAILLIAENLKLLILATVAFKAAWISNIIKTIAVGAWVKLGAAILAVKKAIVIASIATLAFPGAAILAVIGAVAAAFVLFKDKIIDAAEALSDFVTSPLSRANFSQTVLAKRLLDVIPKALAQKKAIEEATAAWDKYGISIQSAAFNLGAIITRPITKTIQETVTAMGDAAGVTEAAAERAERAKRAFAAFRNELVALIDDLDPLGAALRRAERDTDILTKAFKAGLIPLEQYSELWRVAIQRVNDANFAIEKQREAVSKVKDEFEDLFRLQDVVVPATLSPEIPGLAEIDPLSTGDPEAARKIREAQDELVKFLELMDMVGNEIDENVNQRVIELGRSFIDAALAGRQGFSEMAADMVQKLQIILLKSLALKAVLAGIAAAGGSPTGEGAGIARQLLGFQQGGSFTVGGRGGQDSQLVAFKATPGERVDVSTPAQQAAMVQPAPQVVNVRNINVSNMREASLEAMRSAEGERVVINAIGNNPQTARRFLGGGR